jgi:Rrf2 family transcriptional regulator, iron-sulfur cluster assembly transcription factor
LVAQQLAKGVVPDDVGAPTAAKPKLAPKPRPLMARVGVPNSVFALGSIPLLQRR